MRKEFLQVLITPKFNPERTTIFLDFDGVLCTPYTYSISEYPNSGYLPENLLDVTRVNRLETIARVTNAQIVISSFWRELYPLSELTKFLELKELRAPCVGTTDCNGPQRGYEILHFIEEFEIKHDRWIAIDDIRPQMFPISDKHLVITHWMAPQNQPVGLGKRHIKEAIQKLGGAYEPIYNSRINEDDSMGTKDL